MALTARQRQTLVEVKRQFTAFARDFTSLSTTRAELAPRLVRAYALWVGEQTGPSTWIAFVRFLDPTVPADRDAYRIHKSYMAADYLRRLTTVRAATTKPMRSRLDMLARTLATILPLVRDHAVVWRAVAEELALKPKQVTILQQKVAATQPLLTLAGLRPVTARIVHVAAEPAAAAA